MPFPARRMAGLVFVVAPFFRVAMMWLYNNDLPHLPVTSSDFGFIHLTPITRTSTLDALRQDSVRTTMAKRGALARWSGGAPFCNAAIPLATAVGPALASRR
jgi:hypothetical protein